MAFKILKFWTAGDMVEYETAGGTFRGEIAYMERNPTDVWPLIAPEYRAWRTARDAPAAAATAAEARRKADLAAEAKTAEEARHAEADRQAAAVEAKRQDDVRKGRPSVNTEAARSANPAGPPADAEAQRQAEAKRAADARAAASPAGLARAARDEEDEPRRR